MYLDADTVFLCDIVPLFHYTFSTSDYAVAATARKGFSGLTEKVMERGRDIGESEEKEKEKEKEREKGWEREKERENFYVICSSFLPFLFLLSSPPLSFREKNIKKK